MNKLVKENVKNLTFNNDLILGVTHDNINYVGVTWVCKGIGLTDGQSKAQKSKVINDNVLSKGVRNFVVPSNGGDQSTIFIELSYLPLWLAKISITPNMEENQPEVTRKLIEYQLKAKDVLAKAFLDENKPSYLIEDEIERAKRWIKEREETRQLQIENEQTKKELEYKEDVIIQMVDKVDLADKRQMLNTILRKEGVPLVQERWTRLYKEFQDKYHINLKQRIASYNEINKPKIKTTLEYIEKIMGKLPELYELAVKLYENNVDDLVNEMYYLNNENNKLIK